MKIQQNLNGEFTPLAELIDTAKKFTVGLISEEEFAEYGQNMVIRQYIPLMEKVNLAMSILTSYLYSDTEMYEIKIGELYKNLFFYGMLQGYAFIDCSDIELITYENYDLLYPLYGNFILQFCSEDYKTFINLIHDSINMYSIKDISNAVALFSADEIKEAIDSNRILIEELDKNKGLIGELGKIAELNNPFVSQVAKELKSLKLDED